MRLSLTFLFFLAFTIVVAQPEEEDLSKRWKVFEGGKYQDFKGEIHQPQFVSFQLRATEATGAKLKIRYRQPLSIFINQQLIINNEKEIELSIDSIRNVLSATTLQITIFHPQLKIEKLATSLVRNNQIEDTKLVKKSSPVVPIDFVVISALVISLLLLTIILLNPKLASDYFSVVKLFSFREREEGQVYNRITGSTNFLFFGFSALTLSLVLTLSQPFVETLPKTEKTLIDFFLQWFSYTGLLLLIIALRMINTYFQAWLYNAREVAGLQFFNWVRAVFLLSGFCLFIMVISHITALTHPNWLSILMRVVLFGTLIWNVIAIFKVANKVQLGLFHLFSYLCVTEIVPSLIIFKLLY
ncbi:MAG: DUF4271 domain-containing protein [Cyclobacteriaceae bacterium]|nr:DUF4271 domain-containing protein [Cyclobacteriaceae bacterium]